MEIDRAAAKLLIGFSGRLAFYGSRHLSLMGRPQAVEKPREAGLDGAMVRKLLHRDLVRLRGGHTDSSSNSCPVSKLLSNRNSQLP